MMSPCRCPRGRCSRPVAAALLAAALGVAPGAAAPGAEVRDSPWEGRANHAADPDSIRLERQVVTAGLRHPWGLAFIDPATALVTEKDGGLWLVDLVRGTRRPVAGLPADIANVRLEPRDNSGLFDVAIDPRFAISRRIFLAYAAREGQSIMSPTATRLISARLVGGNRPRLEAVETLFTALPYSRERFHYGGGLLIQGDWLYLTVGERHYLERDNPPLPVSQDPSDLRGKIFRFALSNPALPPEQVAMGIRAAQGMALQPGTGRIWFTEHGPTGGDELNILEPSGNYGWPVQTYGRYRDDWRPPAIAIDRPVPPVFYWADRTVAPTGLAFITGTDPAFADWRGDLLVAGLGRGHLVRLDIEDDRVLAVDYLLEDAPVRLRNVKEAPDGGIYVLTDEPDGRIIRLTRSSRTGADR